MSGRDMGGPERGKATREMPYQVFENQGEKGERRGRLINFQGTRVSHNSNNLYLGCKQLACCADVTVCEADVKVWIDAAPAAVPNDPDLPQQWALNDVRVGSVWAASQFGSNTIKVCMVDTGSDLTHPDLTSNLWINPGESNAGGATSANGYVNGVDDDKNGTQTLQSMLGPLPGNLVVSCSFEVSQLFRSMFVPSLFETALVWNLEPVKSRAGCTACGLCKNVCSEAHQVMMFSDVCSYTFTDAFTHCWYYHDLPSRGLVPMKSQHNAILCIFVAIGVGDCTVWDVAALLG